MYNKIYYLTQAFCAKIIIYEFKIYNLDFYGGIFSCWGVYPAPMG